MANASWSKRSTRAATRPWMVVAAVALATGLAPAVQPLTSFEAGKPIKAADVNANFKALSDAVGAIEGRTVVFGDVVVQPPDITSSSMTDVQNLHVKVTVGSGECVRVEMAPGPAATPSAASHVLSQSSAPCTSAAMELVRDGQSVLSTTIRWGSCPNLYNPGNPGLVIHPSSLVFWDRLPPAGSHVYTVRAAELNSLSPLLRLTNVRLIATRLPCS